jgi:hypothetical protein
MTCVIMAYFLPRIARLGSTMLGSDLTTLALSIILNIFSELHSLWKVKKPNELPSAPPPEFNLDTKWSCWVCVIFFARVVVSERLHRARRGVRGGVARPPLGGCSPLCEGSGAVPPKFFFWADIFLPGRHISGTTYFWDHMILGGFLAHGFLPMVFYFQLRN